jgi:hypothetical protein
LFLPFFVVALSAFLSVVGAASAWQQWQARQAAAGQI